MKKSLLLLLLFPFFASAQTKPTEVTQKSNIEDFSDRSGSFTQKVYTDIAKISGLTIQALKITDITSNKTITGLRLEASGTGTYSTSHAAFLDANEVDGLLKTINYLTDKVLSSDPPVEEVEYNFLSRSGFKAGAFNYNKKWLFYVRLEKYSSDSQIDFNKNDIEKIKQAISDGKAKL